MENNKKQRQHNCATETPRETSTPSLSPDENNDIKNSAEQVKDVCKVSLEGQIPELEVDNLQSGGPDKHANSHWVGNGFSSCGLKTLKKVHKETVLEADEELTR
ncbi:uncharacterized protein LOC122670760 [Telopea speciosissima]|uniref:uncharacterized protein LOC122670760 n=1 Tax=Telopea speciosissima TaxID=54955 RepID=UPI001CC3B1FC|nr:uncharacterized protein LOC122670760 [Telopea speciosissima]